MRFELSLENAIKAFGGRSPPGRTCCSRGAYSASSDLLNGFKRGDGKGGNGKRQGKGGKGSWKGGKWRGGAKVEIDTNKKDHFSKLRTEISRPRP